MTQQREPGLVPSLGEEEYDLWQAIVEQSEVRPVDRHGYPSWLVLPAAQPTWVYADWLEEQGCPEAAGYRQLIGSDRVLLGWSTFDWTEASVGTGDSFYWSREGDQSQLCWDHRNQLPREVFRSLMPAARAAMGDWSVLFHAAAWAYVAAGSSLGE